jgi:hypothetical protein
LEALPNTALPQAPKREEEGRAVVGHGVQHPPQGSGGKVPALPQPLANGQFIASTSNAAESAEMVPYYPVHHAREFRLLKAEFPKFDGSHPKLWKEHAEKY